MRACAYAVFDDASRVMLVCECGRCLQRELARPVELGRTGTPVNVDGTLDELMGWVARRCPEARPVTGVRPRRPRPNLRVVR